MARTKWMYVFAMMTTFYHLSYQQNITCEVPSDIVFVLDGSESLAETDFVNMKSFVNQVLQHLEVEEQYTRIGVIVFGTFPEEIIELNSTYNKVLLSAKIVTLPHPKSGTGTARALERMRQMFTDNGRTGVKRVGVVITDGKSVSPTDTKNQASFAEAEGIEMIAIGFGDNVFRPELDQIASSTAMVFNSTDFNALLNSVVDSMKGIVCQVITTTTTTITTTPQPTTTTTQLVTQKVSSDAWCPNCIIGRNWGFKSFSGDCTKFIEMFPDTDGTGIETVHSCPFGTFWNLRDITCDYSVKVDCADDPCKGKAAGSVPMPGNCGAYWACVNGQSMASCCPKQFQRYDINAGCVDDRNCSDTCPPNDDGRIVSPQVCRNRPDTNDEKLYFEDVPGHGNISRRCPPGTAFLQDTCSCSKRLDKLPSLPIQECNPDVHLNFDGNFHDVSSQSIAVGLENMVSESMQAVFGGNGMVNMWRFSNTDFKQKLTMSFEFQASNIGDNQQALVTNCIFSDQEEATISIMADRLNKRVIFRTETSNGTASVDVPYTENAMNKVAYIYDGNRLTGIVNGIAVQAPLTGDIERRQSGIILGAGSKMGSFNGRMDDFKLFMCWPTEFLQYVNQ